MDDTIKKENYDRLIEWESKADLCLSLGTSMCGMNSDRVASNTANKALCGDALGLVIINLQRTPYDDQTSIRIFSTLDK